MNAYFHCPFQFVQIALIAVFFGQPLLVSKTYGQQNLEPGSSINRGIGVGGAECGIYSFLVAAKVTDSKVDERALLNGNYVSSTAGSSGGDLIRAARDNGIGIEVFRSVSTSYLRSSQFPVLLNLKGLGAQEQCSGHWITFLGDSGGKAFIFDVLSPERTRTISYGELLTRMTGDGVVVFPKSRTSQIAFLMARLFTWIPFLAGTCFLFLFGILFHFRGYSGLISQLFVIIMSTAIWLGSFFVFDSAGLLQNPGAISWVQSLHVRQSFRDISFEQFEAFRKRIDVTIIDARSADAFEYGHIPGAVNLPIDLDSDSFSQKIISLAAKQCLVVYCNNPQCSWAETVAQRLVAFGFSDVRIFRPGIMGFVSRKNEVK